MPAREEVDVPPAAFETKPWFPSQPGADLVREIYDFLKVMPVPHLWRGHSHTKPPANAFPVYLGKFDLPDGFAKTPERWATCPCCSPRFPKFYKTGRIAWFPEEGVIRLLGAQCFRALNREGHDRAEARMRADERRAADISYLLSNLGIVPSAMAVVDAAMRPATAIDEARTVLINRLGLLRIPLWDQVRDGGELRVRQTQTAGRDFFVRYSAIEGTRCSTPNASGSP